MNLICNKEKLNDTTIMLEIIAPEIAQKALPGQFLIVRSTSEGERIPLTISDYDRESGKVKIIFQMIGQGTQILGKLNKGEFIQDVAGPLGVATHLSEYKKVVIIGGGVGCAIAYPQAKFLHSQDALVTIIAGFKNKQQVILENEMKSKSDKLIITTDDGSYGEGGFVTNSLKEVLDNDKNYDAVIAIGPVMMMKAVSDLTREYGVKTIVSLNPIMIDGTGMCGGCRVTVGGIVKFACVDGPDFDGHEVDFVELAKRNTVFSEQETVARNHSCNLLKGD